MHTLPTYVEVTESHDDAVEPKVSEQLHFFGFGVENRSPVLHQLIIIREVRGRGRERERGRGREEGEGGRKGREGREGRIQIEIHK